MTTTTTALVPLQPAFSDAERLALAGFLAGYRGLTREAYALDPRQFTSWCRAHSLNLFAVRRADIEGFARDLEARGRARATVTRRLCTIAGFYKYTVEEELLEHSPAAHVRRPRVDYESHAVALDRNELGALLIAAGLGQPPEHALISLLALNGLRVSEAAGADIEHLGLDRGHRTLTITRKGGKVRYSSYAQARVHYRQFRCRVPLRNVQEAASHADPRTTMRCDQARGSLDRHATYIVAAYIAGAAR
jgi:integrase/recombinase XerD